MMGILSPLHSHGTPKRRVVIAGTQKHLTNTAGHNPSAGNGENGADGDVDEDEYRIGSFDAILAAEGGEVLEDGMVGRERGRVC